MNELWQALVNEGQRLIAGASSPFLLHDPDAVWLVRKGTVDVFFVRIVDGQSASNRRFVFSVAQDECLLGLAPIADTSGWGLIGAGSLDTEIYRLDRRRFMEICRQVASPEALTSIIDRWIHSLTRGIVPPYTPREFMEIPVGHEFQAGRREFIRPRGSVLWFKHTRGSSTYLSNSNLVLQAEDPFIPLCRDIWLETQEAENAFMATTTADYLRRPDEVWRSLAALGGMVTECLVLNALERSERELAKTQERQEMDQRQMTSTMEELVSVLRKEEGPAVDTGAITDPLLKACSLVGAHLGIEIHPSPKSARIAQGRDSLDEIGRASHTRIRAITLRGNWWQGENGPLLGFRSADDRPVAILPGRHVVYDVVDPQEQTCVPVDGRVAAMLSPSAFTFYRSFPQRALQTKEIISFAFRDCWRDGQSILVAGMLGGLLGIVLPVATGIVMDSIIPAAARGQLFQLGIGLMAAAFAGMLFQVSSAICTLRIQTRIGSAVQAAVWDRLLGLPVTFFRKYTVGDLAMRAYGLDQIRQLLTGAAGSTILGTIFSAFSLALLFHYSQRLAIVAITMVAIYFLVATTVSYYNLKYQKKAMEIDGRIFGYLLQFITGIAKLRTAGAEMRAYAFWAHIFSAQRRVTFTLDNLNNWFQVFNTAFNTVCTLTIYGFLAFSITNLGGGSESADAAVASGGGSLLSGPISTGAFIAFMAAFGQFLAAMSLMSGVLAQLLQVVPLYNRARPIFQTKPETTLGQTDPGELRGEIEVNSVSFRYDDNSPEILKNLSLRARPGEFIAIVGPSGCGKSTLLRLLLGFEKPQSGAIYYDGNDLSELDVNRLRQQFGVALQNGRILAGNIFDNIIGATRLTMDDAWAAAQMAGLADDIRQMPMGMHTFITEGGGTLSGGQRQRLLIARALACKPKIILFDEATSALDNITQAAVSASLEKLDATRIVIAHRLSTIAHADTIYVMQDGGIVEHGNYEELMRKNGVFAQLAHRQIS